MLQIMCSQSTQYNDLSTFAQVNQIKGQKEKKEKENSPSLDVTAF